MMIKVWDIPTRLFHWLLAAAFGGAYLASTSEPLLEYHATAGYSALALVALRIFWGFAGSPRARFSDFVKGPSAVSSYLRQMVRLKPPRHLGHNPAVGWAVLFMLAMTVFLATACIITYSGEESRGFLASVVSYDTGVAFAQAHELAAWVMLAVIAVHVSAALFHDFVLRENLVLTMITGTREDAGSWSEGTTGLAPDKGRSKARLAPLLAVVVISAFFAAILPPRVLHLEQGGTGVIGSGGIIMEVPPDAAWEQECSACHGLFHPTLLPARSWAMLMGGLQDHFGDDASLDPETAARIESYLANYPAEVSVSEASRKILASIDEGHTPVSITGTGYWKRKHSEIKQAVWKRPVDRSNCAACHPGADRGSFEDADIKVPE